MVHPFAPGDAACDLAFPEPLVGTLRELILSVDRLWQMALDDDTGLEAVALGEASLALHRALIALTAV